jgi:opacity protein-like surface antigen
MRRAIPSILRSLATARLAVAIGLLAAPAAMQAEGFVDLRMGPAFSENGDLRVRSNGPGPGRGSQLAYDPGFTLGVRGGYWFEDSFNWLGLGLDFSYFHALEDRTNGELDIFAMPLTPLLMLRAPLASDADYPGGRVQPYAGIGPALTLSVARLALDDTVPGLDDFYDAALDVGVDVRAGIAFQVSPRVALFAEYRYTYLDLDYDDEVDLRGGPDPDFDVDTILRTHHPTFGVSFRF